MIKIENDIYYMTAGETCMILKNDGGTLKNVYFGKRVEFEDDLSVLGYGSIDTEETDKVGGVKFRIVGATVQDDPLDELAPNGGKSLVIAMCAEDDVTANVYYTPHGRGGFSRRTVITNNGDKPIDANRCNVAAIGGIKELVWVANGADGKTACGSSTDRKHRAVDNFLAATTGGNAYGFLCAHGDGEVSGKITNDVARITVSDGEAVVKGGEKYISPEMLAVFSDGGIDGMSRVLHDILRGDMDIERLKGRRPIVLFCPNMPEKKMIDAAEEASELGCDVFAVDVGAVTKSALDSVVKACRAAGIKPGISVSPDRIKQKSAIYNGRCVSNGEFYNIDFCSDDAADEFSATLIGLVEEFDIEYLMIDIACGGLGKAAKGVRRVRRAIVKKLGEGFAEWGIVPMDGRSGRLLCYPPCLTRNVVELSDEISLKTAFDTATVGCLGYRFDPLSVTADVKRAIRAQIFSYQDDAPAVMLGDLYRTEEGGCKCAACVTKDKSRAYVVCVTDGDNARMALKGLDEHNLYHVRELNKTFSGAALMAIGVPVPVGAKTFCLHIRQVADYE